jgi:hypothetical protein
VACWLCDQWPHDPACALRFAGWEVPQPRAEGTGGPVEPPPPPQWRRERGPSATPAEVEAKAEEARRMRADGATLAEVAAALGHSTGYVSLLISGKRPRR